MDNTPQSYQNSSDSGCFDASRSLYESTPNTETETTPHSFTGSRKRKASFLENYRRKNLADVLETSCPASPQFSSTFNESLSNNLENFHIQNDVQKNTVKIFRSCENSSKKIRSAPNTPLKQVKPTRDVGAKANTNSFVKNFSQINVQSPLNIEAYGILYPDLPPLEPLRKPLTPQKFKESLEKSATAAKKCLFTASRREIYRKVFTNNIIMSNIFKHLSDGDLYRVSMVSKTLKDALMLDMKAYDRYRMFLHRHKGSKENYRITPPKSPENRHAEASPGSKNFYYFCNIASELNKNQSLVKCPRCNKPSIVENFIGQCQDVNSCGYIFCQKCSSFANNPRDFRDRCNNAQLVNVKQRSRLGDLSNSTVTSDYVTDNSSSFFTSSSLNISFSNKYDSSGFFSEGEASTPKMTVKRNLSQSFSSPFEAKPKALSSNNVRITSQHHRTQRRASLLPVVRSDNATLSAEIMEPSSPPKIKPYSVCSKQSKRNLKRLTRSRLGDLSNSTVTSDYVTDNSSSFFTSSSLNISFSNKYDSSGFFSEGEASTPKMTVKRNLSQSFSSPFEAKPKALSSNNVRITSQHHRTQRRASLLPVVRSDNATLSAEIMEPSSPPKIKPYSVCSKQSKRNLKRLTR